MSGWRAWVPALYLGAGVVVAVIGGVVVHPRGDVELGRTMVYLGIAITSLGPVVTLMLSNLHAQALLRELANLRAHELDQFDKHIERLKKVIETAKSAGGVGREAGLVAIEGIVLELAKQACADLKAVRETATRKESGGAPPE